MTETIRVRLMIDPPLQAWCVGMRGVEFDVVDRGTCYVLASDEKKVLYKNTVTVVEDTENPLDIADEKSYEKAIYSYWKLKGEMQSLRNAIAKLAKAISDYEEKQHPVDVSSLSDAEIRNEANEAGASDEAIERTFGISKP